MFIARWGYSPSDKAARNKFLLTSSLALGLYPARSGKAFANFRTLPPSCIEVAIGPVLRRFSYGDIMKGVFGRMRRVRVAARGLSHRYGR